MTSKTFAPTVKRRTPTWPSRIASYYDCSKWGSGFFRVGRGPGAVVLNTKGEMLNMATGEIYVDARFVKEDPCSSPSP